MNRINQSHIFGLSLQLLFKNTQIKIRARIVIMLFISRNKVHTLGLGALNPSEGQCYFFF